LATSSLWIAIPIFHTPTISRVARISFDGSPFTNNKSARRPVSIRPRSINPNSRAGLDVAAQTKKLWDLIASLPKEAVNPPPPPPPSLADLENPPIPKPPKPFPEIDSSLDKIMRVENRIISLTVRPRSVEDAVLLVLYGQKILRVHDSVTGAEVMSGITATGGIAVSRVDRLLEKMARDGDVIVVGEHRSKTYRLTNTGLAKARQLADDLLAIVA
jgi:hypothetical protein